MSQNKQNDMFQHAVLAGLWVLILCAFGKRPHIQANNFRSSAIAFGDEYGNPNGHDYRREITYGGTLP